MGIKFSTDLRKHEQEGAELDLGGWLSKAYECKMDAQWPRRQLAKVNHWSISCFLSMKGELFSMYFLSNTKKHSCNAYANLYLSLTPSPNWDRGQSHIMLCNHVHYVYNYATHIFGQYNSYAAPYIFPPNPTPLTLFITLTTDLVSKLSGVTVVPKIF